MIKPRLEDLIRKINTTINGYENYCLPFDSVKNAKELRIPKKTLEKVYLGMLNSDQAGFTLHWSEKDRGFGEYCFYMENEKLHCNSQRDSRETVKRILCRMVDDAIFADNAKPDKSKKAK